MDPFEYLLSRGRLNPGFNLVPAKPPSLLRNQVSELIKVYSRQGSLFIFFDTLLESSSPSGEDATFFPLG